MHGGDAGEVFVAPGDEQGIGLLERCIGVGHGRHLVGEHIVHGDDGDAVAARQLQLAE